MSDSAPTPVTVRGQSGFQQHITTPFKQSTIAWQETPQIIAAVFSPKMAPDVLLQVAEGLKSISPDEFQKILSTTPQPPDRTAVTNVDGSAPSPPATFTCADHDSTAPQGQRTATCSDLYRPPLWPAWLPNGFALSQIERTPDAQSDHRMLQYTTSVPGIDGVNDILMTIEASSPSALDERLSLVTSQPQNFRVLPTTVRGHEAFIFSDPTGQNHSVAIAWIETPSTFVELESSRVSVNQLRQMAESLAPILNDDWNTKVARNELLLNGVAAKPYSIESDVSSTSTTTP
jgi:hypothetical protein